MATKNDKQQAGQYAGTWEEIRMVLEGRSKEVCETYVMQTFKKASTRKAIRTHHFPVMGYLASVAAGAFALPLRVSGVGKVEAEVVKGWRSVLDMAWKFRMCAGYSLVHLRQGDGGEWLPEILYPQNVRATANVRYQARWDKAIKVEIDTPEGLLIYERLGSGKYAATVADGEGANYLGELPALPIFCFSRLPMGSLLPPPDSTILDLHVGTALQLSHTEFRMRFRTAQMYRKSTMVEANKQNGGSDVDSNPDAILELGETDSVGLVESGLKASEDIAYVVQTLALACRMLGLPPELWDQGSRSETGAARAWDWRPLLLLEQTDRAQADEAMAGLFSAWALLLGPAFATVRARTSPPKTPDPADRASHAAGVKAECELGLTSVVREISRREGCSFSEAERIYKENLKAAKKLSGPVEDVDLVEDTTQSDTSGR